MRIFSLEILILLTAVTVTRDAVVWVAAVGKK